MSLRPAELYFLAVRVMDIWNSLHEFIVSADTRNILGIDKLSSGLIKFNGNWQEMFARADPGLVNAGAEVEAPQAPRGVGFGEGYPPPQRGGVWGGGCPSPENF